MFEGDGSFDEYGRNSVNVLGPGLETLTVPTVDPNFCFVKTSKPITYEQFNRLSNEIMNLTGLNLDTFRYYVSLCQASG